MAEITGPVVPYVGGKWHQSGWIIAHLDAVLHHTYVEPFGGMGSVLLQKRPSEVEVLNDVNGDLVHMMKTIRDRGLELQRYLGHILYSRQVFDEWHRDWKLGLQVADPIERAARTFYLYSASFSSKLTGSFRTGKTPNVAKAHLSRVDRMPAISRRLREVIIEHKSYEWCLFKYDGEDTLAYIDPPYLLAPGVGQDYYLGSARWGTEDHVRLSKVVKGLRAKVLLSYYPHPLLDELYPEAQGWHRDYLVVKTSTANVKAEDGEGRESRVEMLIANFEMSRQLPLT